MNRVKASRIRKEICISKVNRDRLESLALRHRIMIDACLITRFLGTKEKKRKAPAYYLSRKIAGKTRLQYISKNRVRQIKKKTDAWREYASLMKRINALGQRIMRLFRQLGKAQINETGGTND